MAGALAPGAQLGEAELAERLEVSRGPVREALQRLVQEGILVAFRNRGVFVLRPGREDVADVYLARTAVETAGAMAVMDRGRTGLEVTARALASMEAAEVDGRWPLLADMDAEFHRELVAASGSARLQRAHATLLVETRLCLTELGGSYRPPLGLAGTHRRLFEAVARSDRLEATRLIADHMREAEHRLGALFQARAGHGAGARVAASPYRPGPASPVLAGAAVAGAGVAGAGVASAAAGPEGGTGPAVAAGQAVPAA